MSNDSITSLALQGYNYSVDKPAFSKGNYQVFTATQK